MEHTLKIIADSGSTKTDWYMGRTPSDGLRLSSVGLNPFFTPEEEIIAILDTTFTPELLPSPEAVAEVHFYGAGCTPEMAPTVAAALRHKFPRATIQVESDLVGATRALCGREAGIAGILGTGSNSCEYNGQTIISQVSPLGFILGDEGSGAYLGKRLVGDVLKQQLPPALCQAFEAEYGLTRADIIYKVYKEAAPNRFLASLAPFLNRHRRELAIRLLLVDSFRAFFRRNVRAYRYRELPCHLVGSIAYHFPEELRQAAAEEGIRLGRILKTPMEGLLAFHFNS